MKSPFVIDKRITVGEAITVISIIFSAVSVLFTWRYEQKIQLRENATRTRVEIARTLNTINQVFKFSFLFTS